MSPPALSGGQVLSAGSHPGRKPQGPPPSEGKIPCWKAHPCRQRPQVKSVGEVGVCVWGGARGRLEELAPTAVPPEVPAQRPSPVLPPGQIWNRACGLGEKVGP